MFKKKLNMALFYRKQQISQFCFVNYWAANSEAGMNRDNN